MHLADCTNTPKSKAKHHENAELELQKCKERALACGDKVTLLLPIYGIKFSDFCSFIS